MTPSGGTIIFDDTCAFCRRQVERIRRRDRGGLFAFVGRSEPDVTIRFPALEREDLGSGLRLVTPDGVVHAGADAVYEISRRLPGWRRLAWLYRVPGLGGVFRRLYGATAANRHRL